MKIEGNSPILGNNLEAGVAGQGLAPRPRQDAIKPMCLEPRVGHGPVLLPVVLVSFVKSALCTIGSRGLLFTLNVDLCDQQALRPDREKTAYLRITLRGKWFVPQW